MANSTSSSPSSPVVSIPKQPNDDVEHDTKHPHQVTRKDPDDYLVQDILFMSDLPTSVRETDIKTLLQHCMPIE